jgi:heme/copper-type cytochrome/quinol oxidase subunit 2
MLICAAFLVSVVVLAAFMRSAQISHREEEAGESKRDENHPLDLLWIGISLRYVVEIFPSF